MTDIDNDEPELLSLEELATRACTVDMAYIVRELRHVDCIEGFRGAVFNLWYRTNQDVYVVNDPAMTDVVFHVGHTMDGTVPRYGHMSLTYAGVSLKLMATAQSTILVQCSNPAVAHNAALDVVWWRPEGMIGGTIDPGMVGPFLQRWSELAQLVATQPSAVSLRYTMSTILWRPSHLNTTDAVLVISDECPQFEDPNDFDVYPSSEIEVLIDVGFSILATAERSSPEAARALATIVGGCCQSINQVKHGFDSKLRVVLPPMTGLTYPVAEVLDSLGWEVYVLNGIRQMLRLTPVTAEPEYL